MRAIRTFKLRCEAACGEALKRSSAPGLLQLRYSPAKALEDLGNQPCCFDECLIQRLSGSG